MQLSSCIHKFFTYYLRDIRGLSPQTLSSYKVTFKLFLPFAAKYLNKKINSIEIKDLTTNLILSFLDSLESDRNNCVRTRNIRLAAIKSLAKMIRLLYPEIKDDANRITNIPQKRELKPLVGFLSQEELLDVFSSVNLQKQNGFRDYVILHLLYDSGGRASEITDIKIDDINVNDKTIAILGKGQRYRIVQVWEKTIQLVERYVKEYRNQPKLGYQDYLFINQRGEKLTRHGIYRICKKYLCKALPEKRLIHLNSVHCFRHSIAVHMLMMEKPISDIKNHLGHEDIKSTMIYLKLDQSKRKKIQKNYIEHMSQIIETDNKINELIDWENSTEVREWLDKL